jgi:predicted enzyme related to lactoylglutathione lyase
LDTDPAYFTWYELITTDVAAAAAFYRDVVGWGTKEASTSGLRYMQFMAGEVATAGLMELPEEGRKQGASPRWMGYVGVHDVNAAADRVRKLGGTVYVPPTDTNIGRISVLADPYTATFGVIDRQQSTPRRPADDRKPGRVGWHELFAADLKKEVAFYGEVFGWQRAETQYHFTDAYLALSAGEHVFAGAFKKGPEEPDPFWLFYFNVEDLDAAAERVSAGGGLVSCNDEELPSGLWVAHCSDPQGAAFALQGKRKHAAKVGWSTEWQGFSSRGQVVTPKPRPKN